MSTLAATYNDIEQSADRAFAYALLARQAKAYLERWYRLLGVAKAMDGLIQILTPARVEWLIAETSDDGVRIKIRLGELHHVLVGWARSQEDGSATRLPWISDVIRRIQDRTEDLGDIVEAISLASNPNLMSLVSSCASALKLEEPGDQIGRMQS